MLYLGVSSTHEDQLNVLQALTRKFRLGPDVKLLEIAEQCPFTFTGADFYALCSDAMLGAMSRKAMSLEEMIGAYGIFNHLQGYPRRPCRRRTESVRADVGTSDPFDTTILSGGACKFRGTPGSSHSKRLPECSSGSGTKYQSIRAESLPQNPETIFK